MGRLSVTCPDCGGELASMRPRREPLYALRIVTCPQCGRIDHAPYDDVRWFRRRGLRIAAASLALIVQLLIAAALLSILCGFTLTYVAIYQRHGSPFHELPVEIAVITVSAILGLGVWLRAALAHWSLPVAYAMVTAIAAGIASLDVIVAPLLDAIGSTVLDTWPRLDIDGPDLHTFGQRIVAIVIWLGVSLFGVPIGAALRTLDTRFRRARRASYRTRRRRSMQGKLSP